MTHAHDERTSSLRLLGFATVETYPATAISGILKDVASPTVILEDSVAATRNALAAGSDVVGWVDITSPNLVDLLDDLAAEGSLVGVRWNFVSGFANDMCVLRGLRTLADTGLAVLVEGSVAPDQILQSVPELRLL